MSKKRGKSSSAAGGRWEAGLMATILEDENWKVNIHFVMENVLLDETHVKALADTVKIPQRRLFSFLHKDDIMDMVNELGNPKNKKPATVPRFFEITEIIFGLMSAGQEVPLPLWAKLIKFGLVNIKDLDLKRRENEAKSKEDKAGGGKGSAKKRPRSKSPGKGKGKKTPEPQLPKKDWSTLKKRGEGEDDNKYIDDEPDDGPQHYIFVSGFRQPQLIAILDELGINISSVIKISSESYDVLDKRAEEKKSAEHCDEEAAAALQVKHEADRKELALFWKLLPVVLQKAPTTSKLQDLAILDHVVRDTDYPADWDDQDNMIGYGTLLFEELACKAYDSLDWKRQYLNYMMNVTLHHIPAMSEPISLSPRDVPIEPSKSPSGGKKDKKMTLEPPTTTEDIVPQITPPVREVDTRYYRDLMDCVPMESVSVPLIVHSLLEQVVATEVDKTPPSEKPQQPRADGIHLELAQVIAESLEALCLSDEEDEMLANDFSQYKEKKEKMAEKNRVPEGPVLLNYGDDASVRTHHLKEIDNFHPKLAEEQLLTRLPCAKLLSCTESSQDVLSERQSRLHELQRYLTAKGSSDQTEDKMSDSDIDRAFRQFVFENMGISDVGVDGNINYPVREENIWDDPYTAAVKNFPQPSDQEKESSDESHLNQYAPKRMLDGYIYTESFKTPILMQMLDEARQMYPSMETYCHKRDNSVFVFFHFPMSDDLKASSKWHSSLHSDVGFRNYLEYVADLVRSWTKKQEQKYQAELLAAELEKLKNQQIAQQASTEQTTPPPTAKRPRSKSPKKGSRKGSASRSSSKVGHAEEQQFSSPYIRPGSLKAEHEIQLKQKEEEMKLQKEKEAKAALKSADRKGKAKSAGSKTSQDGKRSGSKSPKGGKSPKGSKSPKSGRKSPKGRKSRSRSNSGEREVPSVAPTPPSLKPPFTGYDVGNNLIHINGSTSYLYPCDGGTIKTEVINFEKGQTFVKTTTSKDGHTFVLHIVDPKDEAAEAELDELIRESVVEKVESAKEEVEKAELETTEKDEKRPTSAELLSGKDDTPEFFSKFGSWCATLSDGMTLSLSENGADGISQTANKASKRLLKLLGDIPPSTTPTPLPPGMESPKKGKKSPRSKSPKSKSPRGKSPKGKKKGDAEKEAEAHRLEEQRLQEELERKLQEAQEAEELARKRAQMPQFQQLYLSTPDGLSVRYNIDPSSIDPANCSFDMSVDSYKLMVRQSYSYKTSGKQDTEKSRSQPAMEEVSRTILANGTVIKLMKDGSTKILYGDGTVCYNAGSGPLVAEQKVPITPHSLPSAVSHQPTVEDQRAPNSAGSKKGSRGRKSSGKTNPDATATDPSLAGTITGHAAAGLEAEAGAKLEADNERASSWLTTYMDGEVVLTKPGGVLIHMDSLLSYVATDPVTGEVMYSREDKVVKVDRADGCCVCDHNDGTRITKFIKHSNNMEEEEESSGQWCVRVECPGYASVTFNQHDLSCMTLFGSGTTLRTEINGTHQMAHWNGGKLDIAADGAVVYIPRPDNDFLIAAISAAEAGETLNNFQGNVPESQAVTCGTYMMRHNTRICCEAVDQEGNVFQVNTHGECSVINPGSASAETGTETSQPSIDPSTHHPPKLFVIHSDGTGTQLLRLKDVQDYIGDAHLDPTTAVIREPLPDNNKSLGITIMRPHYGNSGDAWILHKEEGDIIPSNIKTRDLSLFPPEGKIPSGPEFGTTVGKGLAVGSAPGPPETPYCPMCPSALELRRLVEHRPISKESREHLFSKLKEYGQATCEQEALRKASQVHEPRTSEEQTKAKDLLSLVLGFDEEGTPRSPDVVPAPSAGLTTTQPKPRFGNEDLDQNSSLVKLRYEIAVAPPPLPVIPPPRQKLTEADWDIIKRGIEEVKEGREALKRHDVPAYFDSESGRAWLLSQANNMKDAALQLSNDPRRDGTGARMVTAGDNNFEAGVSDGSSSSPIQDSASDTPRDFVPPVARNTKTRPLNPTPAHASGGGTPTKVRPENPTPIAAGQQQRNARPSNPTPSHALSQASPSAMKSGATTEVHSTQQYQPSPIPENPTSAQQRESQQAPHSNSTDSTHLSHILPLETEPSDLILTRSLLYDATGQPRKERVQLPASILSDKPGAFPNTKFLEVEEPVRRKVMTSSIAGGLVQGHNGVAERGFQLLPPEVVFGVLCEGCTYSYKVMLKNTGIDSCRFKVKQPPPGTGIRVHYTPKPVAAGMSTDLTIQVYAIAVGVEGDSGVGTISHQLQIVTETDILHLPITAIVLTSHDYENRNPSLPEGGKAPGVKLCSNKPPSREGIIRPTKIGA